MNQTAATRRRNNRVQIIFSPSHTRNIFNRRIRPLNARPDRTTNLQK